LFGSVLLWSTPTAAQVIPPGLQNLPSHPEVPYAPSGIAPTNPLPDPLEDAELRQYSEEFWKFVDSGDPTGLAQHKWTAPGLLALIQGVPGVQVDEWDGGLELFGALYQHRLKPINPTGYDSIRELIENDATIGMLFKHWTRHHQLATAATWDNIAHTMHISMLFEAYFNGVTATVHGVPLITSDLIISDRLDLEVPNAWFAISNSSSGGSRGGPVEEAQACIDAHLCDLKSMPWKEDGFFEPGFDCDDFADALGARISKGKPGVTATTVRVTWKKGTGSKSKGRHQVTKISAGGKYWILDGQVGGATGPHDDGTPMDAEPALTGPGGGYDRQPGSTRTEQSDRPLGERPWVEPAPWTESREMIECFEKETGKNAADYTP
jgi:hypothetical protein